MGRSKKYYVYLVMTAVIIFSAKFWPGIGVVSPYGSTIVGIFAGVILGYCTIGMTIPSFMALIALSFSGYDTMGGIMRQSFGNSIVVYIISVLILSAMLEKSGLASKLVNWLVTRKFARGKPWVITLMFLVAAYITAFFINSIPSTIICWALLGELFTTVGYQRGEKWPIVMMFGVMYTSALGSCVPSFQVSIVSNFGLLSAASHGALVLNPLKYMIWSLVCSGVLFAAFFAFIKYIVRPDVSLLRAENIISEDEVPLNREQKMTIALFVLFVIGLLLPCILPEGHIIKNVLGTLSDCGWGMLIVLMAIAIQFDGEPLYRFDEMFTRGVIWELVLMIATVFTIVDAITGEGTGVPQLIIHLLSPLQAMMPAGIFLIALTLLVSLLCNLTNSVAVCSIFVPVVYVLMAHTDFYVMGFVGMLIFLGNVCFLMPSASVNAAMMYNQKEWIPAKFCLMFALYALVSIYLVMIVVGAPLAEKIF